MKNKSKKTILFPTLIIVIIVIAYAIRETFIEKEVQANSPKVQVEMFEELANGQSKIVNGSMIDGETSEWLHEKKTELSSLIAEQTKLENHDVLVTLAPTSTSENADSKNISCTVLLVTDSIFDDETMNKVVEAIISTITKQDAVKANISEEAIVITNANHEILYMMD